METVAAEILSNSCRRFLILGHSCSNLEILSAELQQSLAASMRVHSTNLDRGFSVSESVDAQQDNPEHACFIFHLNLFLGSSNWRHFERQLVNAHRRFYTQGDQTDLGTAHEANGDVFRKTPAAVVVFFNTDGCEAEARTFVWEWSRRFRESEQPHRMVSVHDAVRGFTAANPHNEELLTSIHKGTEPRWPEVVVGARLLHCTRNTAGAVRHNQMALSMYRSFGRESLHRHEFRSVVLEGSEWQNEGSNAHFLLIPSLLETSETPEPFYRTVDQTSQLLQMHLNGRYVLCPAMGNGCAPRYMLRIQRLHAGPPLQNDVVSGLLRLGWHLEPIPSDNMNALMSHYPPTRTPTVLYKGCRVISRTLGLGVVTGFTALPSEIFPSLDAVEWPTVEYESGVVRTEMLEPSMVRSSLADALVLTMTLPIAPVSALSVAALLALENKSLNNAVAPRALEPCFVGGGSFQYRGASLLRLLLRYTRRRVHLREAISPLTARMLLALSKGWTQRADGGS